MGISEWIARAVQDVILPSGQEVKLRLPNVAEIMLSGALPQEVLQHMDSFAAKSSVTMSAEELQAEVRFREALVLATVVEPELSAETVSQLPQQDIEEIVSYALRRKALGKGWTIDQVGAFARSDDGLLYRIVCEHFGVDPGAPLEDDYLAFQLRTALYARRMPAPAEDLSEPFRQTRAAGLALAEQHG